MMTRWMPATATKSCFSHSRRWEVVVEAPGRALVVDNETFTYDHYGRCRATGEHNGQPLPVGVVRWLGELGGYVG
jgi:hypothetical protein